MLRIGVDFDNTIACYDRAFRDVAAILDLVAEGAAPSKEGIKAELLSRPEGDVSWQRLQGQVYGKHMLRAQMFPGFLEFLHLSKLRGHEVIVVSHKSEFGHFDEERVPLRDQAMLWMREQRLFGQDGLCLTPKDVFFEATREQKIERIRELRCTHFIDDLQEVFDEPGFPVDTRQILFRAGSGESPTTARLSAASWRDLTHQLLGSWTEADVAAVAQARFPKLGIERAELRKGKGNSRVYELVAAAPASYALKVYPDRQLDSRPRLETEFSACTELLARGYPVAEAVVQDTNLGWGIYRWIRGSAIGAPDAAFLDDAIGFVRSLRRDSRTAAGFGQFALASEACLSGAEITRQIQARLDRLATVDSKALTDYLGGEFVRAFKSLVCNARRECGELFERDLPRELQMVSPSDFGSHNALRAEDRRCVFIDFEYFGWDDPVKLVCDFYLHPGMHLQPEQKAHWVQSCLEIFEEDPSFASRLNAYLPLYGLRWCLILLNEFLQQGAANRVHADPDKVSHLASIRSQQLERSRALLREIKETRHEHGSAVQVS